MIRSPSVVVTALLATATPAALAQTNSPIQHVIVIVGENHTFDNVFGGYKPKNGQKILNLRSEGIIDDDGNPGLKFSLARQKTANPMGTFTLNPTRTGAYQTLPQPNTTSATGQPAGIPDPRFPSDLTNGPFQITNYAAYSDFTGDPVHRFFQMWQQVGLNQPKDLFVWVAETAWIGNHNSPPTAPDKILQGGVSMGFYNMATGDAPFFAQMADNYAISDNYHQAVMGGTGANFLALVTADAAFFNSNGTPATPPSGFVFNSVTTSQIENPDPQPGLSNPNWYTEDGYRGGSYVNCADPNQPGVKPIRDYLAALKVNPNCASGTYYLVNNYNLAYKADGTLANPTNDPTKFTLPTQPPTLPTIADLLAANGVSWKYYSGGRGDGTSPSSEYCGICDPLTGFTSVMTTGKKANLQDINNFYADLANGTLPAVSFIRPLEQLAGHPANAVLTGYENFTTNLANLVHDSTSWNTTAIFITVDEGGGYYDSGYIQPVDFFGDGTRIPLIAISPYAVKGLVDHTYYDHASILKFIEWNWSLGKLSGRSRDNLPNPKQAAGTYNPTNGPAIGDLRNLFKFAGFRSDAPKITPQVSD